MHYYFLFKRAKGNFYSKNLEIDATICFVYERHQDKYWDSSLTVKSFYIFIALQKHELDYF